MIPRTLIATIKDFGKYPCPRCLVSVDQIPAMGREDDQKHRDESCRKDDIQRRNKVDVARKSLYDEGYAITGDHVDGLLRDESLVPTKVLILLFTRFMNVNTVIECIFRDALPVQLRLPWNVNC